MAHRERGDLDGRAATDAPDAPDAPRRALRVERLGCARGGRWLFRDLSFELHAGQALALRGPNGSGKSSLLRQLAGLLPREHGVVEGAAPADLAYLAHQNGLSLDLSARENLALATRIGGRDLSPAALEAALEEVGLRQAAATPARRLSQGQRRRLALARVRASARPLWLLDEPTAALDGDGEQVFARLLTAHLEAGGLAVVATHQALALPLPRCIALTLGPASSRPASSRPDPGIAPAPAASPMEFAP